MKTRFDYTGSSDIAWCPGCGNYPLLMILKQALEELDIEPSRLVISSGIGQAAKMPQYIDSSFFNGLHGRGLAVAVGIKLANPELTVIAEGGDGDMYGEGGNHFIHNIRRNVDVVHLVHNNMIYGLTQGQGSPTSPRGLRTTTQPDGVVNEPFNPLATALAAGAGFVARTFVGNQELSRTVIEEAVRYPGYALVDIFDPCVSFNKVNTFTWYRDNTYALDETYDPSDLSAAVAKSLESGPFPIGILYRNPSPKPTLEAQLPAYRRDATPLYRRKERTAERMAALMR